MAYETLNIAQNMTVKDVPEDASERNPAKYLYVELDATTREELEKWVFDHWSNIEQEMQPVQARWARERNQFDGKMPGAAFLGIFRVNVPVTKRKTREITNRIKQAYLDSDPIWAIDTNNPELQDIAQDIERGLDTCVDHHLEAEDDLSQDLFEAGLHGCGLTEPGWDYLEDIRREVVEYQGFNDKEGLDVAKATIKGLQDFEKKFPNWREDDEAKKLHQRIARGETIRKEVSYVYPTRNQPTLRYIPCAQSRVYPNTDGYSGLRTTPCYGYVKEFTREELDRLLDQEFIDEEAYNRVVHDKEGKSADDQMEPFEVFIATVRYQLPGDDRPVRYKVWQERQTKAILRIRAYTWWYGEPDLIPKYINQESQGFYKTGIAEDIKDDHTVLNVLMNLFLNGAHMIHSMKFKVKEGSAAERHLLRGAWQPHIPMPYETNPNEVDPMPLSTASLTPLVQGFELMRRNADEGTGTSSLQSGRESPTDPNAPGNKTALLLQQVEPTTKEYIRAMQPAFRQEGRWILWLYYQGASLGWIESMPGAENVPVEQLPEIAEALNPRALLFESDRQARSQTDLAVVELVAKVFPQRPDLIGQVVKVALSHLNSDWARRVKSMDFEAQPQPAPAAPGAAPGGQPGVLEQLAAKVMGNQNTNGNGVSPLPAGLVR